ncbi:hypothetical protein ARMGADRAFT_1165249 [Armillaria gallica]|uniref:Uncharacterized protein n=1 Tax=Armillaria gallica TaxID=47427 RepID=A0A2H3DCJ1_ARMGA|nr:hypothetical protein ARMGADRAFT_1165249 [Armillaria gallica]
MPEPRLAGMLCRLQCPKHSTIGVPHSYGKICSASDEVAHMPQESAAMSLLRATSRSPLHTPLYLSLQDTSSRSWNLRHPPTTVCSTSFRSPQTILTPPTCNTNASHLFKVFLLLCVFPVCHGTGAYTFRHLLFTMAANPPKDSIDLTSPALQQLGNHITTIGIADDRDLRKCVEEEWERRLSSSKFKIEPQRLMAPVWGSDKGMEGLPRFEECGLEKATR